MSDCLLHRLEISAANATGVQQIARSEICVCANVQCNLLFSLKIRVASSLYFYFKENNLDWGFHAVTDYTRSGRWVKIPFLWRWKWNAVSLVFIELPLIWSKSLQMLFGKHYVYIYSYSFHFFDFNSLKQGFYMRYVDYEIIRTHPTTMLPRLNSSSSRTMSYSCRPNDALL